MNHFKGKQFKKDVIIVAVGYYLRYNLSYREVHQLAQSLFPNFLEYSRFVRRCNALLPSIQVIRQALVFKEVEGMSECIHY